MKLLIFALTLLTSFHALADAWDNMTYEEAEAVVTELEINPFIFDYCDCCDYEGEYTSSIEFIKVTKAEIIPCDWNQEMYSVKIIAELISSVQFNIDGANIENLTKQNNPKFETLIYMNYTWSLNSQTKLATPFFNIISYDYYGNENKPCLEEFKYPTPKQLKKVKKVKGYKKWWKMNIKHTKQ